MSFSGIIVLTVVEIKIKIQINMVLSYLPTQIPVYWNGRRSTKNYLAILTSIRKLIR